MRARIVNLAAVTAAYSFLALLCMGSVEPVAAQATDPPMPTAARHEGDFVAGARLQAAARRGNARAQAMLGYAYATGKGVPQNFALAATWYRRSAKRGNATAQYLLGMMYDHGQGVHEDKVLAQKWLILATAHANDRQRDDFRRIRDAVASSMTPQEIAHAQALALSWARRHRR